MRKLFLLFVILILLSGCRKIDNPRVNNVTDKLLPYTEYVIQRFPFTRICVVNIQGCEYLVTIVSGEGVSVVHKANCSNPEHGGK